MRNLRGKTINMGSGTRTVTYWLSKDILSFIGLAPGDYTPLAMTSEELGSITDAARLPDAVFISTVPPSALVRRLVVNFNYRLVPIPFGEAFRLSALHHVPWPPPAEGIRKEHIVISAIPAFAYSASPPVPPTTIPTVGCRVLLICHKGTDRAAVVQLLDLIMASRFAEAFQPDIDANIVRQYAEVPWHLGALDYRSRDEPLITGERIGVLSNALQIFLPAGGTILLLWGWLRNRVMVRRELRFDRFIALVSGVEKRALELEHDGNPDPLAIHKFHHELCIIKDAALERIALGEASDSALVLSLFAHITDVREFLAHLERSWPSASRTHE